MALDTLNLASVVFLLHASPILAWLAANAAEVSPVSMTHRSTPQVDAAIAVAQLEAIHAEKAPKETVMEEVPVEAAMAAAVAAAMAEKAALQAEVATLEAEAATLDSVFVKVSVAEKTKINYSDRQDKKWNKVV